jgi:hypothetical protein
MKALVGAARRMTCFELGDTLAAGYLMLHEIFHTLGAAPECAPHHHRRGHAFDDRRDLMYAGEQYWQFPLILDVGRDDYFGHADPDCLDVSRSVFLDPLPANASKPPGWP